MPSADNFTVHDKRYGNLTDFVELPPLFTREIHVVTNCLFSCTIRPSEKGSTKQGEQICTYSRTLVISNSLILNYRLSRSENLVPVLT